MEHRWRDRQLECLGRLQIYNQLELRRLLDREVGGLGTFQTGRSLRGGSAGSCVEDWVWSHTRVMVCSSSHEASCRSSPVSASATGSTWRRLPSLTDPSGT